MDASPDESDDATRIRGAQADEQSWQLNWDPRLHHTQDPYWQQYWHGRAARYWEQDEAEPPRPPIPPQPPPVRPRKRPPAPRPQSSPLPRSRTAPSSSLPSRHRQSPSPYRQAPPRTSSPGRARHAMQHAPPPKAPGDRAIERNPPSQSHGGRLTQIPARNREMRCADSTNRHTGPGARRAIA